MGHRRAWLPGAGASPVADKRTKRQQGHPVGTRLGAVAVECYTKGQTSKKKGW